jgi:hypothetical protein
MSSTANLDIISPKNSNHVTINGGINSMIVYPSESFSVDTNNINCTVTGTISDTDGIINIHLNEIVFDGTNASIVTASPLSTIGQLIPDHIMYIIYIYLLDSSPSEAQYNVAQYRTDGTLRFMNTFDSGTTYTIPKQTLSLW